MSESGNSPTVAPTMEQLQQLKRGREAALIRRWTSGVALSPEEMAEIAHILPPQHLAQPPMRRAHYDHDYAIYAAQLGYDVRNIKRLVAVGKKAQLLPPFDDPAQLANWWERMRQLGHLKQQVPQRIHDFLSRLSQPVPASTPEVASQASDAGNGGAGSMEDNSSPGQKSSTLPPSSSVGPATTKVNFAELEAIGLEGAVRELTIQLSAAQRLLRESREAGLDDVTINRRQKNFDTTLDSLRKTEKAWQDLQKDRGDLAPVSDFRKDLTTIATTLRGMMKRRADNICSALADTLPAEHLGLVRAAIINEGEREQVLLRTARHWKRSADGDVTTD